MNIERLHNGAWQIYESDDHGYLFTMTYYGYTKRDAMREFRSDLNERNKSYA